MGDFRFIQRYASAWDSDNFVVYGEAMGESAYYFPPQLIQAGMTMCTLAGSMMRTSGGLGQLSQYHTNQEITPLISDPYAKCGREVFTNQLQEVFVRPLGHANSGTNLVGIYNGASTNQTITLTWSMLGVPEGETLSFRDLWAGTNFVYDNTNLTVSVAGNTIMLFKEWPSRGRHLGDCPLTVVQSGESANCIRVSGIPGTTYAIQFKESLAASTWQPLAIGTAGALGIFQHDDALPPGTRMRFYRAVAQPGGNPGPAPFSPGSPAATHGYDRWQRPSVSDYPEREQLDPGHRTGGAGIASSKLSSTNHGLAFPNGTPGGSAYALLAGADNQGRSYGAPNPPSTGAVAGPPLPPAARPYRPNGWSSYNDYQGDIGFDIPPTNVGNYYQAYITNLAAVWLTNGMYAAGFRTFWLDDGWQALDRDDHGNLQANPLTMTNGGVQGLTAVLHHLGYRVILYTAYAPSNAITCSGFPGTTDATLQQDLNLFATWDIDGIEFDACSGSDAISSSGGTVNDPYYTYTRHEFASIDHALANVTPAHTFWTLEVLPVWPPPPDTPFHCNACGAWGAPGAWGFPDSVDHIVGDFRFIERYASAWDNENFVIYGEAMGESTYYFPPQFNQPGMTMCALAGSMMRTSGGLDGLYQYFTNQEITPLISDPYAKCGREVFTNNLQEVFVRPLGHANSGTNLVGIYNGARTNQTITLTWSMLGVPEGETLSFRDLWAGTNFVYDNTNLTVSVAGKTIMLFKEWPSFGQPPLQPSLRDGWNTQPLSRR